MQPCNLTTALPKIWIIQFITQHEFIEYYLESLEQFADGVRSFELVEDSGDWVISLHFNTEPDLLDVRAKINLLAEAIGNAAPELKLIEAENKNWVEEIAKEFKAIKASRFYIYSQFSEPSGRLIDIKINPGMAFGTGQHETTYLCLEAITHLQDEGFKFNNILDLGCGSGILAIAARKVWGEAKVLATDNDPIAVKVAIENGVENNVELITGVSEGFNIFSSAHPEFISGSLVIDQGDLPILGFDLILANILMNPLLDMAGDVAKYSNGLVVLSGFKTDQVERIMEKYSALGFKSERIFVKNHWVSLLLSK